MTFNEYPSFKTIDLRGRDPFGELLGRFARDPSRTPVSMFPSIRLDFDPLELCNRCDKVRCVVLPKFIFLMRNTRHLQVEDSAIAWVA